ncbi:MAG: hypothetical protein ACLSWP_12910 [Terrisporobacter sp.]|uniref:hypothetical protein n=1 Tax=Terrisporobacter sp. TaxID=1965305 RepID=UPI00399397F4
MRKNYRWNSVKAIKQSVGNILNSYIGGEVDGEVLRNVIYAANCLISACKTINEEELEELREILEEIKEEKK